MMEVSFAPREDGYLEERDRHISISPEEKMGHEWHIDRAERRAERRQFRFETRRANLALIRK